MKRRNFANPGRTPMVAVSLLLLVVLAILVVLWFRHAFVREDYPSREAIAPAARANPLLAAAKYLRATGIAASCPRGLGLLADLPPAGDAILIPHLPREISGDTRARLFAWVQEGGHLLLVPNPPAGVQPDTDNQPIADRLGVRVLTGKAGGDCGCSTASGKRGKQVAVAHGQAVTEPLVAVLKLQAGRYPIRIRFTGAPLLEDTNQRAARRIGGSHWLIPGASSGDAPLATGTRKEKKGAWLLDYDVGAGRVTVLSDMKIFTNQAIGHYDHAFFLSRLLIDAPHVWLLYSSKATPLPTLLWRMAPFFWVSCLILLLLGCWRLQQRSGTLLGVPGATTNRDFMAHIEGAGHFCWCQDKLASTIAANRHDLLAAWSERRLGRLPGENGSPLELVTLANRCVLPLTTVEHALELPVLREQDLIRTTRAMQRLRSRLQKEK